MKEDGMMSRDKYVSREGLKQWLEELIKSPWAESTETRLALELVRDAAAMKVPASLQIQCEDVEPVVHARWVEWFPGDIALIMTGEEMLWECSHCTAKYAERSNHCPNCGARMDGGEEGCG